MLLWIFSFLCIYQVNQQSPAMQTNISITVPKPCHEDWNKMTPNENGAFCGLCQKTVVDFSTMPTEDIKNYLIKNASKKVCGRFQTKQLEEMERVEIPMYLLPKHLSSGKVFLVSLLLVFGTTLFSCTNPEGRTVVEIVVVDTAIAPKAIDTVSIQNLKVGQVVAVPVDSIKKVKHKPKKKNIEVLKTMGEVEMVKGDVAIEPIEKPEILMGKVCVDPNKKN